MSCSKNRLQIAILILDVRGIGGVNTRSAALAKQLKSRYDTKFIRLKIQGSLKFRNLFSAINSTLSLVYEIRAADLVISFSSIPNLVNSIISKKSIVSLSGSTFFRCDTPLISRLYWTFIFEPLSVLLSDAVVPASPAVLKPLLSRVPLLRRKMEGIYGFLDCGHIDHCISRYSTNYNWIGEGYFLFIGELVEQKGILELVDIYGSLPRDVSEVQVPLVICGQGKLLTQIAERCEHFSLKLITSKSEMHMTEEKKCIIWLGLVSEPYSIIQKSALVLSPFYWEGLSNVMLESLYLNTPVIASRNPSSEFIMQTLLMPERNSINGCIMLHLVDHPLSDSQKDIWRDRIIRIMRCPIKAQASRKTVYENFSAQRNRQKWYDLIEGCIY